MLKNNIRCIVVDDEPLAHQVLENFITRVEKLEWVAGFRNAMDAYNFLAEEKVDLIFLDIQMPQLSGINFAKNLKDAPQIIFTTAYRDYAVESYEVNALDYLVKPIAFDRFLKAIEKLNSLESEAPQQDKADTHIYLKADKKIFKVLVEDILYVESFKDYIVVHQNNGENITTYQSISQIEKNLNSDDFLRIHRSYLIALKHIHSFSATYVFIQDKELPIGRTYKERVAQILKI